MRIRILDVDGQALMRFATSHEKQLHLIVVRTDGTQFRHVHPTMDSDGRWSVAWEGKPTCAWANPLAQPRRSGASVLRKRLTAASFRTRAPWMLRCTTGGQSKGFP